MSTSRLIPGLLVVAATTIALTGCGMGTAPAASPTSSGSDTSSRTPTPTATPTPTPAAAGPVVSTAGLGDLRMGRPVPAGTALVVWDPTACVSTDGTGAPAGQPSSGMWVQAPERATGSDSDFGVLTSDGTKSTPVVFMQVFTSRYRTPSGLHVGSTDAEVHAALPAVTPRQEGVARWYSVVSAGWRITLTVASESDATPTATDRVQVITVCPASDSDSSWWQTDVGAHCPA